MKISIITIVFNRKEFISDCIQSVLSQSYSNIEYIIIDGGSSDGTQEVISQFREKLAVFISEKDEGIYDALNKGIKYATGDIIGILNSDDMFYNSSAIEKVAKVFGTSSADLVYANGVYVEPYNLKKIKRIYPSRPFRKYFLNFGWIPLHTTIFVKKEVFKVYGIYNASFTIAGDYEISLRWFENDEIKKHYLNEWVVKMRLGGLSTTANLQLRKSKEDLRIIKQHKLNGYFTLAFKIGRKIPQFIIPKLFGFRTISG